MESIPAPVEEPNPAPKPMPVMDVVPPKGPDPFAAPSPSEVPSIPIKTEKPKDEPKNNTQPAKLSTEKKPASGVTTAIIATVIIVLGLAALATYAYLKQK